MRNPQPKEWLASQYSQHYVADYKPFNFVDGQGVRNSLYVSGCLFACEGCFNKAVQNFRYTSRWRTIFKYRCLPTSRSSRPSYLWPKKRYLVMEWLYF